MTDSPQKRAGASNVIQAPNLLKGPMVVIMATTGLVFCWPPWQCGRCQVLSSVLRNAGGRTFCAECQRSVV